MDADDVERAVEALLFAAAEPLSAADLARRLPEGADVGRALATLKADYQGRGVMLECVADRWRFATAADLAYLMTEEREVEKKLSKAAMETLAIIAYHQPVTRADIEAIRGVGLSRGTLDLLLEIGWVRLRGRRRSPGRPVTFGTTDAFLEHFALAVPGRPAGRAGDEGAGPPLPRPPRRLHHPRPVPAGGRRRPPGAGRRAGVPSGFLGGGVRTAWICCLCPHA